MLSKAHKGLALGMAPLGYCIVEQRYVIDEEAAALVRRIFDEYETGRSTTVIARGLNTEGVPTVRGAPWNAATILQILKRVAYAGTYRWNNGGNAQYSQVTGGIIAPVNKRAREKKLPDDAIVIEGHHEAIIDPKRFARIQKLLKANAKNTSPRGFDGPFILSGLLTCGRCGSAMHGRRRDDTRIVFYVCSKSLHEPGKCWTNAVRQDAALAEIVAGIRQEFSEESMAAVEAQIRELHSFERPGHSASLERRLVVVGSKIEKAKRRLVEVDRDMVGLVQQQIRELQGEQARLGAELAEASKTADSSAQEFRLHAAELADAMRRLEAMMETAPAREVRECLRTIISGAVVHTEAVRLGPKRTVSRLKFVEITAFC
jgi:site-specific DNA recombinase